MAQSGRPSPSAGRLSRQSAAALLERSPELKKFRKNFLYIFLDQDYPSNQAELYRAFMRAGYIDARGAAERLYLLPKGRAEEAKHEDFLCDEILGMKRCEITLGRAGQVEVTGISAGERQADVEFTWKWTLTPVGDELRKARLDFTKRESVMNFDERRRARATFQLYDDGWRVRQILNRQ